MQTTIKPVKVKASARTPKRGLELIDGHFRLAAAQQLIPQLEVPVGHVKRTRNRPRDYEEAVAVLNPYYRMLAAQDPARLRFKLQKKPSAFTNPESSNQQGLFQLCIDGGDQQAHTLPR